MRQIGRIVVFGDSLLDNGNIMKTLDIPGKPYHDGRFSNGLVSTEVLADILAKDQKVQEIKHKNYAIGGALTHGANPSSLLRYHSFAVSDQVARFENEEGRFADDDLVIVNGGANNFMFMVYNEIPYINLMPKFRVARDLSKIVSKVIKMGAKNIILWNIPDVTRAPGYKEYLSNWVGKFFKSYLKTNVNLQNGLLRNRVAELQMLFPSVNLKLFDFFTLLNDCIDSPRKYGFENVTDACVDSYGGADSLGNIQYDIEVLGDPEKYLCWDYCHPTAKANRVVANKMLELWKHDM
ncbi:SGNH/GDSL hydrolase family protein [Francisella philomiragia]|uniref:SGNH/GDSL hydrolase family protein n=1 Tax=Francisella philomiragia TaxID=28110 RepID=A0ABS1GEL8_9GAMM|nr:SGNH/GDSL hydrolase family protein [Francisella philomiragia]MBK2095585.1 SGNH/GDSL hydrolase family protein [Francisella philomiragia]MBK2259290.1 SGNH/GDSL hydrolase family protein [Francisella philomiragia]MBK2268206.1 SGNH/GDSL hydrolase family protein [Francisella philomiragia]MBK2279664.1 SGNH/GDSL hydrolase family protein [Francisella philomiragia]MBK2287517.1 SGNH/GDSL hydrolase family protein [Francisella philomiragia]